MGTAADHVREEIGKENCWYVGDQFGWAEKPSIRLIYEKRFRFFSRCIERQQQQLRGKVRLLDAGCGDGYWLHRLNALNGLDLVGVDYNPLRVERARNNVSGIGISCMDIMDLQETRGFDVILLSQIIEHVEDDVGLLKKMATLLRDGGTLILGTPNEGSFFHQWYIKRQGNAFETDHVHFYREIEIKAKIRAAGFKVERVMREVFKIPSRRIYYGLTRRRWGFVMLEVMTRLWPSGCSDFYFECLLT
jgi:2-polyprenyl-3-methyl-5-hydroxy-6-metoxy-1,4-benzoquinol methylase